VGGGVELADAELLKGIDLMIASNHYLALENEVIEMYLQRMNPDLLVGKVHIVEVLCYHQINYMGSVFLSLLWSFVFCNRSSVIISAITDSWNGVLLEKLTVPQQSGNFLHFVEPGSSLPY
jgi:hypothetical protein